MVRGWTLKNMLDTETQNLNGNCVNTCTWTKPRTKLEVDKHWKKSRLTRRWNSIETMWMRRGTGRERQIFAEVGGGVSRRVSKIYFFLSLRSSSIWLQVLFGVLHCHGVTSSVASNRVSLDGVVAVFWSIRLVFFLFFLLRPNYLVL